MDDRDWEGSEEPMEDYDLIDRAMEEMDRCEGSCGPKVSWKAYSTLLDAYTKLLEAYTDLLRSKRSPSGDY